MSQTTEKRSIGTKIKFLLVFRVNFFFFTRILYAFCNIYMTLLSITKNVFWVNFYLLAPKPAAGGKNIYTHINLNFYAIDRIL